VSLSEFNASTAERATATLTACCDVPSWVDAVRDGRPYAVAEDAFDVADKAARDFTPADVERALAAHPRIGERAPGSDTEALWSRQEQSAVATDTETKDALVDANRAYEERFGRVFLICATGLSSGEILAAARERLGNDDATEDAVVADELRKIALLRLRKVLES
jgi:2-oxo-4-hydroxy-4-carboxy-5-ureidoimidazoline decarboxylase